MDPWAPNAIRRVKRDHTCVRVHILELTCGRELERGELVEVLRGALPDTAPFWALTPLARTRSAAASALLAWLAWGRSERITAGA